MRQLLYPHLLFAAFGIFLAIASLVPETWLSLISAVACALSLSLAVSKTKRLYWGCFISGVCFHVVAFYWVPDTIQIFGGFSFPGALAVHALFVFSASLQFVLFGFLVSFLRTHKSTKYGFVLPLAWVIAEYVFPRLFPWQIGHALVVFSPIAGSAEYLGVTPLSGLIVWWGASIGYLLGKKAKLVNIVPVSVVTLVVCLVGITANNRVYQRLETAPEVKVALVQGNLSTDKKGDVSYLQANVERYRSLSRKAVKEGAELIFWPESVVNQWLPEQLGNVRNTRYDPMPDLEVPIVYGTLSFAPRSVEELQRLREIYSDHPTLLRQMRYKKYNAAVAVNSQGDVLGRYYKRILMPFGEFLPFAETFPSIRAISPQTGDFSSGELDSPIVMDLDKGSKSNISMGMLICYEDLIPSITGSMVNKGANLLVNLTNDAWYGDTSAPHQHHLLAQWRAIESRKYFLRVTNTGLSAVVDPFGATISKLPVFEERSLLASVYLLEGQSFYARWGDILLFILIGLGLGICWYTRGCDNAPQ